MLLMFGGRARGQTSRKTHEMFLVQTLCDCGLGIGSVSVWQKVEPQSAHSQAALTDQSHSSRPLVLQMPLPVFLAADVKNWRSLKRSGNVRSNVLSFHASFLTNCFFVTPESPILTVYTGSNDITHYPIVHYTRSLAAVLLW